MNSKFCEFTWKLSKFEQNEHTPENGYRTHFLRFRQIVYFDASVNEAFGEKILVNIELLSGFTFTIMFKLAMT